MKLKEYFQSRNEELVNTRLAESGEVYIITDKSNYKQDAKGMLFKFNNGLLNKNENRWEEIK